MFADAGRPYGLSKEQAMARLYQAHQAFQTDPASALETMAKDWASAPPDYKIRLMNGLAKSLGVGSIDPGIAASLDVEQRAARAAQATYANLVQQAQQAQYEEAVTKVAGQIKTFAVGKPDFDSLQGTMAALIGSGAAQGLEDSYAMARRAHQPAPTPEQSRRLSVEKAKKAATLRSTGYGRAAEPEEHHGSFGDALRAELAART